jgi:hypothetical protein
LGKDVKEIGEKDHYHFMALAFSRPNTSQNCLKEDLTHSSKFKKFSLAKKSVFVGAACIATALATKIVLHKLR